MVEQRSGGEIPYRLITFIVGIVITVIGGYLIAVFISEVIGVISRLHATVFFAGLILFAAGIILLAIMFSQWIRKR